MENNQYIIGVAVVIAALLISITIYGSMSDTAKAVKSTSATVQKNATTAVQAARWADAPSVGNSNAKVTVALFTDPQCPICAIAEGREFGGAQFDAIRNVSGKIKKEYADTGKVRFAYVTMAFLDKADGSTTESTDAANAMYCVRAEGGDAAYVKMHDKIVAVHTGQENAGVYSKANLKKYAADIGYGSTTVAACIDSGKYNAEVRKSTEAADSAGVTGTPMFEVDGKIYSADYAQIKSAIETALKQ